MGLRVPVKLGWVPTSAFLVPLSTDHCVLWAHVKSPRADQLLKTRPRSKWTDGSGGVAGAATPPPEGQIIAVRWGLSSVLSVPTPTPPSRKVPEQGSRSTQQYRPLLEEVVNCGRSLQVRCKRPTSARAPRPRAGLRKGPLAGPPRAAFAVLLGLGLPAGSTQRKGVADPMGQQGAGGSGQGRGQHSPRPLPPRRLLPSGLGSPHRHNEPCIGPCSALAATLLQNSGPAALGGFVYWNRRVFSVARLPPNGKVRERCGGQEGAERPFVF